MALGKQRPQSEPSKSEIPIQLSQIPKKYVVAAAIVAILLLLATMQFCSGNNGVVTRPIVDNYGHVLLLEDYKGTTGIVHDPECEKCRKVLDGYIFRAVSNALDSLKVEVVE